MIQIIAVKVEDNISFLVNCIFEIIDEAEFPGYYSG